MKNTHTSSDISFLHLSGEARLIRKAGGAEKQNKKTDGERRDWADDELARSDDQTFMSESNKHKQNIDWLENISKKNEKDLSKRRIQVIKKARQDLEEPMKNGTEGTTESTLQSAEQIDTTDPLHDPNLWKSYTYAKYKDRAAGLPKEKQGKRWAREHFTENQKIWLENKLGQGWEKAVLDGAEEELQSSSMGSIETWDKPDTAQATYYKKIEDWHNDPDNRNKSPEQTLKELNKFRPEALDLAQSDEHDPLARGMAGAQGATGEVGPTGKKGVAREVKPTKTGGETKTKPKLAPKSKPKPAPNPVSKPKNKPKPKPKPVPKPEETQTPTTKPVSTKPKVAPKKVLNPSEVYFLKNGEVYDRTGKTLLGTTESTHGGLAHGMAVHEFKAAKPVAEKKESAPETDLEKAKKKISDLKNEIANTLAGDSGTGSTYEGDIKAGGSINKALTEMSKIYDSSGSNDEVMSSVFDGPKEFIDLSTDKKYKLEYNGSKFDLAEVNDEVEKTEPVVQKPKGKPPTNVDEAKKNKHDLEEQAKKLKESNEKGKNPVLKMIQTLLTAIMRFITGKKGEVKPVKPGSKKNPKGTPSQNPNKGGAKPKAKSPASPRSTRPNAQPPVSPRSTRPNAQPPVSPRSTRPDASPSAPNQAQDFEETPDGKKILRSDADIARFMAIHTAVNISLKNDNSIVMYNDRTALAVIPDGTIDSEIVTIRQYLVDRRESGEYGTRLKISGSGKRSLYLKTGNEDSDHVSAAALRIYLDDRRRHA